MEAIILNRQVSCSTDFAFDMWTKPELLRLFFGTGHKLELRVNGPYEIYFSMDPPPGQRGSEGCQIIDFKASEFLSFTWNAPPSIPEIRNSKKYTKVTVFFNSINDGSCELNLVHSGWNYEGIAWKNTHDYFQQAWPYVLSQFEQAIEKLKTSTEDKN